MRRSAGTPLRHVERGFQFQHEHADDGMALVGVALQTFHDRFFQREHNPDIPLALEKAIMKSLEREPNQRHPIVSVLVLELKAALYVA